MAGTPERYRPSNGSEGMAFMARYCDRCALNPPDDEGVDTCEIQLRTMIHDVDDPEYPSEWVYRDGRPTCTAFRKQGTEPPVRPSPGQLELFGKDF